MKNKKLKNLLVGLIVSAFWICLWWIPALIIGSPLILPTPIQVIARLCALTATGGFWLTLLLSIMRIVVGITAAFLIGIIFAVLSERYAIIKSAITPIMHIIKAAPVASFIFLILLWTSREILPGIIAGMIVLPIIWENVSAGIRSADKELLEMAQIFGINKKRRLKYIYYPAVRPYLIAGLKSGIGIGWKAGVAAEVLVVPALSIGKMIFYSKQYMETVDLFAWTAAAVLISVGIEKLARYLTALSERRRGSR